MSIFQLIRWKDLVLLVAAQLAIKYALLPAFSISTSLNTFSFFLLCLASACIMAGGFIIDTIYNVRPKDFSNSKIAVKTMDISEQTANILYIIFTSFGVCIGFYISHFVNRPPFFALFVITAALLYVYATYLKQIAIVGSITSAILVSTILLIVGVFEIIPATILSNKGTQLTMLKVILDYSLFIFIIQFVRTTIKNCITLDSDYRLGFKTLPVLIGTSRTAKFAILLILLIIALVVYYVTVNLYMHVEIIGYILVSVIGPLIYCIIKLINAERTLHFIHINRILKLVMAAGLASMLIYKFIF